MQYFIDLFLDNFIDRVYVFFNDSGNVSFVLPSINLDFVYILILVIITFKFVFDILYIILSRSYKK